MSVLMILLILVLILIIAYLLYRFYFKTDIIWDYKLNAHELYTGNDSLEVNKNGGHIIDTSQSAFADDVLNGDTANFMISVWFYIQNWGNSVSQEKNVLYYTATKSAETPVELQNPVTGVSSTVMKTQADLTNTPCKNLSISLDKYQNNMFIDIETYDDSATATSNSSIFTRYLIKNISVQKWNCVTLSVDTKTLDVYLDGKLRNSFILNGLYRTIPIDSDNKKKIYMGYMNNHSVGFTGMITRVRFQNNSIDPPEAKKIYDEGIKGGVSDLTQYGMKVSFQKNGKNIQGGSFTI